MKKGKRCLVVPQDESCTRLEQAVDLNRPFSPEIQKEPINYAQDLPQTTLGQRLASFRVSRDNLMQEMETLVLQEADLTSTVEWLDYSTLKYHEQYDLIVHRLAICAEMVQCVENGPLIQDQKWAETKKMVTTIFPHVLTRLEETIDFNSAKLCQIRNKIELLRVKRLALRHEIAGKEQSIALMQTEHNVAMSENTM